MTKPIPPLELSWLLMESPAGTTHVGAMLLFKKPAGHAPIVREIVETYRACTPAPPFDYVPELLGRGVPHFREVTSWDPYYHIGHLSLPPRASYDDLLRLVADLHEPQLDRDRPLLRCWVIDGVPDGMFAIYTKTHHSIIDGESGLKRLYAGLNTTDRRTVPTPGFALGVPEAAPHPPTPLTERVVDSIRGAVTQVEALNQVSVGTLRKVFTGLVSAHLEGSLPFTAQHAPTNAPLQAGRRFATLSLPLEEMHAVGLVALAGFGASTHLDRVARPACNLSPRSPPRSGSTPRWRPTTTAWTSGSSPTARRSTTYRNSLAARGRPTRI
jgi:diacylglycerol O-acyltransferase / wax synthase